jgi:O-acetyl-ADP-ribose deacetylase (regulator of RNase III)
VIESFLAGRVRVEVGDLTQLAVDAIVNAANSSLLGGGGVDGAIHRAGGSEILEDCREIRRTRWPGGLSTGEAVITRAGRLPARYVIHTVGPIWEQHADPSSLLASCYRRSIEVALEHDCRTIAFPAISTGVYGYPKHAAAQVASTAVEQSLMGAAIDRVHFVFFSRSDADTFLAHHRFESI